MSNTRFESFKFQEIKTMKMKIELSLEELQTLLVRLYTANRQIANALEAKVQPEPAPGMTLKELSEVMELNASGKKIEAIKVIRRVFGSGLKEAKDALEGVFHKWAFAHTD